MLTRDAIRARRSLRLNPLSAQTFSNMFQKMEQFFFFIIFLYTFCVVTYKNASKFSQDFAKHMNFIKEFITMANKLTLLFF